MYYFKHTKFTFIIIFQNANFYRIFDEYLAIIGGIERKRKKTLLNSWSNRYQANLRGKKPSTFLLTYVLIGEWEILCDAKIKTKREQWRKWKSNRKRLACLINNSRQKWKSHRAGEWVRKNNIAIRFSFNFGAHNRINCIVKRNFHIKSVPLNAPTSVLLMMCHSCGSPVFFASTRYCLHGDTSNWVIAPPGTVMHRICDGSGTGNQPVSGTNCASKEEK